MAMSQLNKKFNSPAEAEKLRNALKGPRTDEATIIKVLGRRPSHQRVEIAEAFKTLCGMELVEKLETEISGDFLDTCRGLCYDLREYDAMCLRDAVEISWTYERTVIDILTTRSNDQIKAIKTAYNTMYKRDLEADIRSFLLEPVSDFFSRILVSLLRAEKDESNDVEQVAIDAAVLHKAATSQYDAYKTEVDHYCWWTLSSRSFRHVAAVADQYSKEFDESLVSVINRETSGSSRVCLNSIVSFATDPCVHFAEVIYKCVRGAGKNHRRLQHTIITQCEGDMQGIKNAMQRLHQISLKELVKNNTSGNYRELLLALIR